MPRDQPPNINTPQHASAAPYPPTNSNVSGYSTRGKRYHYSHTKPPTVAPPPRSTKRPPVPASAARKKSTQKPDIPNSESQEMAGIGNAVPIELNTSNFQAPGVEHASQLDGSVQFEVAHTQPETGGVIPATQGHGLGHVFPSLTVIPEEQDPSNCPHVSSDLDEMEAEVFGRGTVERTESMPETPGRHPDSYIVKPTPDRTNIQANMHGSPLFSGPAITISSPSPFAIRAPPAWALEFDCNAISNPSFVSNPSPPLASQTVSRVTNPATQFPVDSIQGPESPIAQRQLSIEARQYAVSTGSTAEYHRSALSAQLPSNQGLMHRPSLVPPQMAAMPNPTPPQPDDRISVPNVDDIHQHHVSPGIFATQASGIPGTPNATPSQHNDRHSVSNNNVHDVYQHGLSQGIFAMQTGIPGMTNTTAPQRSDSLSVPEADDIHRRSVSPGMFAMQANSTISGGTAYHPLSRATTPQLSELASLHSTIVQGLFPSAPPMPFGQSFTLPPSAPLHPAPAQAPTVEQPRGLTWIATTPQQAARGVSPTPDQIPITWIATTTPQQAARGVSPTPQQIPTQSATPAIDHPGQSTQAGSCSNAQRAKRRGDFNYEETQFIEQMKPRWQWYLLAENAFPVDTTEAQELCLAHAETMLMAPRSLIGDGRRAFGYVREKESRMRNDCQRGVLGHVESSYEVTSDQSSRKRVQELIKKSNFLYTSYNPKNLSVITGRFRHPCIGEVMKMVLFPPRIRGRPPGAQFIRLLIATTPRESLREYMDKEANYSAPIALIALACTLVLHALRLLELGHSSADDLTKKRLISFDEATYGNYYRTLVKKLKDYPRLGELRRFHMAPLLKEYSKRYQDDAANSIFDDDDIERFSDGE